jgi:hypothetical protein
MPCNLWTRVYLGLRSFKFYKLNLNLKYTLGVYGPAKAEWRKIVGEFFKKTRNCLVDKLNFPSLLKQLYESNVAFKAEHAMSGFAGTGLFPLNKDRVNKKHIELSRPFDQVNIPQPQQQTQAQPSTPVPQVSTTIPTTIIPRTPANPAPIGRIRLSFSTPSPSSSSSVSIEEASSLLQQSLLSQLQYSNAQAQSGRQIRIERQHHGQSLTNVEIRAQIDEQEKKQAEKLAKKAATNRGKRKAISRLATTENQPLNAEKKCFKCKINYDNSANWRSCEKCDNWCCQLHLPKRIVKNSSLEYFCSRKCKQSVNGVNGNN